MPVMQSFWMLADPPVVTMIDHRPAEMPPVAGLHQEVDEKAFWIHLPVLTVPGWIHLLVLTVPGSMVCGAVLPLTPSSALHSRGGGWTGWRLVLSSAASSCCEAAMVELLHESLPYQANHSSPALHFVH
eukprot:5788362-Amphidinium_carterae.1